MSLCIVGLFVESRLILCLEIKNNVRFIHHRVKNSR